MTGVQTCALPIFTFKRYLASPVKMTLKNDYVTDLEGEGADAAMMRAYLAAWGDREAYAVSHVGFGMNSQARYEALAMYDQRDTNGTEIRAVAGNFLFSAGELVGTGGEQKLPATARSSVPLVSRWSYMASAS